MHGRTRIQVYTWGMKTFLVPVDFSAVSEEIIDTAVTFARSFGGKVVLLHVTQPPIITSEYALPVEAVQETIQAGEKAAAAKLAAYAEMFHLAGLSVDSIVRQGPPVYAILEEADKAKADFIIMGSHGHGRLYDLFIGSTASGVIKEARCGVIIMPPEDRPLESAARGSQTHSLTA
jgi:nucleotide-binding universal stress UspA family protein